MDQESLELKTREGQTQEHVAGTIEYVQNQNQRRAKKSSPMAQGFCICLRELFGTALLTYVGCTATNKVYPLGFIYAALQACSEISSTGGLHLNPAITLGVALAGKLRAPPMLILPVMFFQFLGCLVGAGVARGVLSKSTFDFQIGFPPKFSFNTLFKYSMGEMFFTCILVTVFLRLFPLTTKSLPSTKEEIAEVEKRKYIHALFVGLTIVALTGPYYDIQLYMMMNPFRVFGPMVVIATQHPTTDGLWNGHWVYWVGPLCGGILAALLHRMNQCTGPGNVWDEEEESEG